jgi:hypothetical protein
MSNVKVFTKFRDPVNSYPLGEMNLGIMRPGRYSGFDVMEEVSGLSIKIKHGGRVKKSTINTLDTISEITFGSVLTPNGSVVHVEDDVAGSGITLTVDDNTGNLNPRYDLIVCEHEYVEVIGGQPPLFFIQKGNEDGDIPTLSNPEKQVSVGMIIIEPEGYQYTDLTYIKSPIPIPGDATVEEYIAAIGIPYATESQPGIVELIDATEVLENPGDINDANGNKALTLKRLLLRTTNTLRYGLVKIATAALTALGTDTTTTVTPQLMRRYGGISAKLDVGANFTITDTPDVLVASSHNNYNGLIVVAKGGDSHLEVTLNKLNIKDFSMGLVGKTQLVRVIAGPDVVLITPTGFLAETALPIEGLLIESDGVLNSGVFYIFGNLKNA